MFYDNYVKICQQHGVSPSKAAADAGLSKSTVTKWKNNPDSEPTGTAIKRLSDYFNVPISELLGEEQKEKPTVVDDGLSDDLRELIQTVKGLPEEKVQMLLQVAKSIK